MNIVRVKSTGELLKVWSDNVDEQTYTCLRLDGEIEYDIPFEHLYEDVEVPDPQEFLTSELDRIYWN